MDINIRITGEAADDVEAAALQMGISTKAFLIGALWLAKHLIARGSLLTESNSGKASLLLRERGNSAGVDLWFQWPEEERGTNVTIH